MAFDEEGSDPSSPAGETFGFGRDDSARVLALTDGIFAFAMTLLVISLTVPSLTPGTNGQLSAYLLQPKFLGALFAYALAFVIVGTWWVAHRRLFGLLRSIDSTLGWANLGFLLLIAITPFDVGLLTSYGDTAAATALYAGTQTVTGVVLMLMWLYLGGRGRPLLRAGVPDAPVRAAARATALVALVFAVSVPFAWFSPNVSIAIWVVALGIRTVLVRSRVGKAISPAR